MSEYLQRSFTASRVPDEPLILQSPLKVVWAFKGATSAVGTPLIAHGHIVALTGQRHDIATLSLDGTRQWSYPGFCTLGGIIGGELMVALSRSRDESRYALLDLSSGRECHSSNAGDGSIVAVFPDERTFLECGPSESAIRLRRIEKGFPVVWTRPLGSAGKHGPHVELDSRVACDSERCLVAVHTTGEGVSVSALRRTTGEPLWCKPIDMDRPSPESQWNPAVTSGLLVFGTQGGTACLDVKNGRMAWYVRFGGSRTVYGDAMYFRSMGSGPGMPAKIVSINVRNGRTIWQREYPELFKKGKQNRLSGSLAVSETHLFGGDEAGWVWAFDKASGEPIWSDRPGGSKGFAPWTMPVIAGGRIYLANEVGTSHLYCYEAAAGILPAPRRSGQDMMSSDGSAAFELTDIRKRQAVTRSAPFYKPGGAWTVMQCRGGDARFFLAMAKAAGKGAPSRTDGVIWVPTCEDGDRLWKYVQKAFGRGREKLKPGKRISPPVPLSVMVLGEAEGWTNTKWSGEDGALEFYMNWSLKEKRGLIAEKDDTYRKRILEMFASLVVRS